MKDPLDEDPGLTVEDGKRAHSVRDVMGDSIREQSKGLPRTKRLYQPRLRKSVRTGIRRGGR